MFKYTEAEMKNILKQATVVIDTREQKCGHITEYLDKYKINMLIFWTGGNASQIDRIYRNSSLMRDKWDRKQSGSTYGQITINKCLRTYRGNFYKRNYYN